MPSTSTALSPRLRVGIIPLLNRTFYPGPSLSASTVQNTLPVLHHQSYVGIHVLDDGIVLTGEYCG